MALLLIDGFDVYGPDNASIMVAAGRGRLWRFGRLQRSTRTARVFATPGPASAFGVARL